MFVWVSERECVWLYFHLMGSLNKTEIQTVTWICPIGMLCTPHHRDPNNHGYICNWCERHCLRKRMSSADTSRTRLHSLLQSLLNVCLHTRVCVRVFVCVCCVCVCVCVCVSVHAHHGCLWVSVYVHACTRELSFACFSLFERKKPVLGVYVRVYVSTLTCMSVQAMWTRKWTRVYVQRWLVLTELRVCVCMCVCAYTCWVFAREAIQAVFWETICRTHISITCDFLFYISITCDFFFTYVSITCDNYVAAKIDLTHVLV
jgi:hypothetical protein